VNFKCRLLTTAFVLPVTGWLALTPSLAFDLTGEADDVTVTDTLTVSAPRDDDDNFITQANNILIDGTPTTESAALLINSDDADVVIDGVITIRSRDADDEPVTLIDAFGLKITGDDDGRSIRLKSGARIYIIEGVSSDNTRGPDYDADDDGFADNDSDEDGISEGSPALDGNSWRVGLWKIGEMSTDIIGEAGSSIVVYGNGVGSQHAAGVVISDSNLNGNLDLSTSIKMYGDETRGVDILSQITGYYRQRGAIDVRGADGIGINIGAPIGGSLMIEGLVNATGYSSIPPGTSGGPTEGGEDQDDANEFDATRRSANPNERRQSEAAVKLGANISGGLIIGGLVNTFVIGGLVYTFETKDERDSLAVISERRTDDDDSNDDVTELKIAPYHFDQNRAGGILTSYGEREATLLITADLATADEGTRETFLDTTDDDDDDTAASTDDNADLYNSEAEFFYSHGLLNRGPIKADALYDSVNWSGGSYVIDRSATALKLDGGTIHGGIFSNSTISARAYNADATAVNLESGELTDGLRGDGSIFLNEGEIEAKTDSRTKSYYGATRDMFAATAVKIGSVTLSVTGTPEFTNVGSVSASSTHEQRNADTEDADDYTLVLGYKAIALDATSYAGAFNLTQRMKLADVLVGGETDSDGNVDHSANSATNPYAGGGDTDIDWTGDIGQDDDDNNIDIGDGKFDTRDTNDFVPTIFGDVLFHAGNHNNQVKLTAGSISGHISFGGGADTLLLGNSMADDANAEDDDANDDIDDEANDHPAPVTSFRGRISNDGTLNITAGGQTTIAGEKTRLHFVGQEGVDLDGNGNDADTGEEFEGLQINNLDLSEEADLRFTIDPTFLSGAVLDVTTLSLGADVTLSPFITRLPGLDANGDFISLDLKLIESSSDLNGLRSTINDHLLEDGYPYIYKVSLAVDETGTKDAIVATFALKEASELGLNKTEGAAWPAVVSHFGTNDTLAARLSAITDGDDFNAYYDQLLPQHGDGTMKQLASLGEAATGAVGQHLQIVAAGGRRDGDGWLQQFGDYRKQDATVETDTVSGTSYGLAIGYDAPASFTEALGLYAQMSFTSVNEKPSLLPNGLAPNRNEVKAESFGVGAYLADALGPVRYELSAAAGSIAFDSVRGVQFNGLSDVLSAAWDGTSTSASARIIYPILEDDHLLRVEAGRDYFSLEQDDYTEQTAFLVDPELALRVRGGSSDMTSDYVGIRGSLVRGGGSPSDIVWEPNYYLGWRSVAEYSPYSAKANFVGNDTEFDLTSQDEISDSTELGLGLAAHNDYFAFEFNYRGKFGDGEEVHGGGISVRLLF
jgi:hypothetical protein